MRGNLTLLQATAVTGRWGTSSHGHLSAIIGALAPWVGAALLPALGSPPRLFAVLAAISVVGTSLAPASAAGPSPGRVDLAGPCRVAGADR